MRRLITALAVAVVCCLPPSLRAAEPAAVAKPVKKITPGQAIVPDRMRRLWGELISLDRTTRTGKFRFEENDDVMEFVVMPYAELLHHASNGDLEDFVPGERALFRLHEDENGVWRYLTYIQDEMNFLNNHKEWFFIDHIDREKGRLTCHQASVDEKFVRTPVVEIDVDEKTQYWRGGKPIDFAELKIGDRVQTKTRGTGRGKSRIAWHVFLDTESIQKFQAEQAPIHAARIKAAGLTGYVDKVDGATIEVSLFGEVDEFAKKLKAKWTGTIAAAGTDRQPTTEPVAVTIVAARMQGKSGKVTLRAEGPLPAELKPTALIRLRVPQAFE